MLSNSSSAITVSKKDGEEVIEIPPSAVGNVIGTRGAVITDIQVKTGARVVVNEHFLEAVTPK